VRTTPAGFPKAARLLKTDEFSSVFRLRPWARSAHFVLYGRPTGQAARLGVVVGKKQAPRAVTRNLVKRLVREAFRVRRLELTGWDVLIRLSGKIDRVQFPSAGSAALTQMLQAQIEGLVGRAVREAARRTGGERPVQAQASVLAPHHGQRGPAASASSGTVPDDDPPASASSSTMPGDSPPDRASTDTQR
jgi:ribonuclease P protein component